MNNIVFNNRNTNRRSLLWQVAEDIKLWSFFAPKMRSELLIWVAKFLN
jgi:hypothetical protein